MKTCFKCKIEKPLSEYYKHPQMGDGHLNKCKECAKRDSDNRFKEKINNPDWAIKERERQRKKEAKRRELGIVKNYQKAKYNKPKNFSEYEKALKSGEIKKQPCAICGNEKAQGHHEDYDKPLDVVWLCSRHHSDRHIHLRNCKTMQIDPTPIDEFVESMRNLIIKK